jgi:hypothetical protein
VTFTNSTVGFSGTASARNHQGEFAAGLPVVSAHDEAVGRRV